jgi:CDP-glucose 4,6-dehydratase
MDGCCWRQQAADKEALKSDVRAFLKLDASKARAHLGWRPKLDLITTLEWIVAWFRRFQAGEDLRQVSLEDIDRFMAIRPPT